MVSPPKSRIPAPPSPQGGQRGAEKPQASGVSAKTPKLIGWQGFTLHVPESWDLTGFSGKEAEGYFRIDDSEDQAIEVKWATEPPKTKSEPDIVERRGRFFASLRKRAKREKLTLDTKFVDTYRPVERDDRSVAAFGWTSDRRGIGAVWYCRTCRRVVIAQVLGAPSGRGGLVGNADAVLSTLRCHGDDADWRTWALYDLVTEIPSDYVLESQQLMNVYLRLTFAHNKRKTARLTVEQWALANVARKGAYLDNWLAANTRAEMREARVAATEGEDVNGHPTLRLDGGLGFGMPMLNAIKTATRLQMPATRFSGRAWECEPSNKLYLVEAMRPRGAKDMVDAVAERTRCHGG